MPGVMLECRGFEGEESLLLVDYRWSLVYCVARGG